MYWWNSFSPFIVGWRPDTFFWYWKGDPETTGWSQKICENNKMIVNETKTKVMTFGKMNKSNVYFNDKQIEQVTENKYLGNIVRSVRTDYQDIFSPNYTYLRDRANRAIFLVSRKLRNIEHPPPKIMYDIFDTLIMPILAYDSDVWVQTKIVSIYWTKFFYALYVVL